MEIIQWKSGSYAFDLALKIQSDYGRVAKRFPAELQLCCAAEADRNVDGIWLQWSEGVPVVLVLQIHSCLLTYNLWNFIYMR